MPDESRTVQRPDWVIFQIGRLDRGAFAKSRFAFRGVEQEAELSSLAAARALASRGTPAAIHIFYPVSLPFNAALPVDEWQKHTGTSKLADEIKRAWSDPEAFRRAPEKVFEHHPHSAAARRASDPVALEPGFSVIPSIGAYKLPSANHKQSGGNLSRTSRGPLSPTGPAIKFECPPSLIELAILAEMLSLHHKFEGEGHLPRVYAVDISAGHNIYAGTLWSALRYLDVCLQFMHSDRESKYRPSFRVLVSDPVLPDVPGPFTIHEMEQTVAHFFTYPKSARPVIEKDGQLSVPAVEDMFAAIIDTNVFDRETMTNLIDEGARAWAALNYGIVALLPYIDASDEKEAHILAAIRALLSEVARQSRSVMAHNAGHEADSLTKWARSARLLLIALHLHLAIVRCVRKRIASLRTDPTHGETDAWRVDQLWPVYEELFKELSGNQPSLLPRRELTFQMKAMNKHGSSEWQYGTVLLKNPDSSSSDWNDRRYRNLVAHAGFEHSIYEFCARGDRFLYRYTQEGLERAWEGTYFAMGAVKSANAFRSQIGNARQPAAAPSTQPRGRSEKTGIEGAGSAGSQFVQESESAREAATPAQRPAAAKGDMTKGGGTLLGGTKPHELVSNPAWRAAELKRKAAEVVEDFRKARLFGPCLYWAEVFGTAHGLTGEEVQEAKTPRPPDSPDWRPDYATVQAIEKANEALQTGAVEDAERLIQPVVLVGRVRDLAGQTGVWIEVPGFRDFYAPAGTDSHLRESIGKYVRFRPRVQQHRSTKRPVLMAADCQIIA